MNSPVIANLSPVIANEVTQSMTPEVMDRHASLAMTMSLFKVRVRYRVGFGWLAVTASLFKVRVRYRTRYGGLAMTVRFHHLGCRSGFMQVSATSVLQFQAVHGADALITMTAWQAYRNPNSTVLKPAMKTPVIFDGRNLHGPQAMQESGRDYVTMRRGIVQ